MTSYKQARADFEYLESVVLLSDFVEIDAEMVPFLRNPTKKKACELYQSAISLWFSEHGSDYSASPIVAEIAERYGWEDE